MDVQLTISLVLLISASFVLAVIFSPAVPIANDGKARCVRRPGKPS